MCRKITYHILFCLMILVTASPVFAQSKTDLQNKVRQLEKDIQTAEKLLAKTSKNKEGTIQEVTLLQAQITQRETLINNYEQQMVLINKAIGKNKRDIGNLQKGLE